MVGLSLFERQCDSRMRSVMWLSVIDPLRVCADDSKSANWTCENVRKVGGAIKKVGKSMD
mgnify:CR=1 FL=1